jgi:hypothetical protein
MHQKRLAPSAAQDAVQQWHYKRHYQGSDAVETQAKITVNFTISTNWAAWPKFQISVLGPGP